MPGADRTLRRLGARLRVLREARDLTQGQLAVKVDLSSGKYISEIERGLRNLPILTLREIVERGLGSSLADLFAEERPPRSKPQPIVERERLPHAVEEVAYSIAKLPREKRGRVLAAVRKLLAVAG